MPTMKLFLCWDTTSKSNITETKDEIVTSKKAELNECGSLKLGLLLSDFFCIIRCLCGPIFVCWPGWIRDWSPSTSYATATKDAEDPEA